MLRQISTTNQALQLLGIACSFDRDPGGGVIDLAEILGGKLDRSGADVLFEPRELRRTRDRDDPQLLSEQPCERDLRGSRALPSSDLAKQIDHGEIRFSSLGREARNDVAEVGTFERSVLVDLSGEEPLTQRTERHEADAKLLEPR